MFSSKNLDHNMLKNALFFEKKWRNRRSVGGSAPKPQLAAGGWGLRSQIPEMLLPLSVTLIFSKAFVALTSFLSKRNENNLEIAIIFSHL